MVASAPIYPGPHPAHAILKSRGISHEVVAAACGFHRPYVTFLLNGHRRLPRRFKQEVASLLELPASELFHAEREDGR